MKAYTVWVAHGRIGTYKTPEKAEQIRQQVIDNIEDLVRIQTWEPNEHYAYVTFDDEKELMEE
jgi:hypothetical protein